MVLSWLMADKVYEWFYLDDSFVIGILEYLPLLPSGGHLDLLVSGHFILGPGSYRISDASGILNTVHSHFRAMTFTKESLYSV